ncbi:hypothetical protein D3C87_252810 [compost metagenome]
MKKIIFSGLLVATLFCNTGCEPSEIAAGAIGVAIGVGIGSSHNGHHRHDHYRPPRYRECRGYHRCYSADTGVGLAVNTEALDFAQKHQISLDAATKIQTAFDQVATQGLSAFEAVGLSQRDLSTISSRSMPGQKSLANVAVKLDMSEAQARDLLKGMITEFDAQASNVESPYWQSCMAKGKWKTPQNGRCTTTAWEGCSPENGATLCY